VDVAESVVNTQTNFCFDPCNITTGNGTIVNSDSSTGNGNDCCSGASLDQGYRSSGTLSDPPTCTPCKLILYVTECLIKYC